MQDKEMGPLYTNNRPFFLHFNSTLNIYSFHNVSIEILHEREKSMILLVTMFNSQNNYSHFSFQENDISVKIGLQLPHPTVQLMLLLALHISLQLPHLVVQLTLQLALNSYTDLHNRQVHELCETFSSRIL